MNIAIFGGAPLLIIALAFAVMNFGVGVWPNAARVSAVAGESERRPRSGRLKILTLGDLCSSTPVWGWSQSVEMALRGSSLTPVGRSRWLTCGPSSRS